MSIWRSFVLIFFPLTLIVPLLVWSGVTRQREMLRSVTSERDQQTVRSIATTLNSQLTNRAQLVRGIAEQAAINNDYDLLLSRISFLDSQFDGGLAIFSLNGVPLAVEGVARDEVIDWPSPSSSASPFSHVFRNPKTGELILLVTASNESVQVVGALRPNQLLEFLLTYTINLSADNRLWVIDRKEQLIYRLNTTTSLTPQFGVEEAFAGRTGTLIVNDEEQPRVIAFTPIELTDWALIIEQPQRLSADDGSGSLVIASLVLVPVLLAAFMLIWVGDRQVVRPLRQLALQAQALGQGEFDMISADVGGIAAIQQLQEELRSMANRVEIAQENLRSQVGAITQGQEEERRRLARELHDDTIQSLIALNQRIQLAQLKEGKRPITAELATMKELTTQMIADVRRFTHALRPVALEELGLLPALQRLIENSQFQTNCIIELKVEGEPRRLPIHHEFAFYRIAQEGINNALQHAQPTLIKVQLTFSAEQTTLTITDDGKGFLVPTNLLEMARRGNYGLLGAYERAELIGAELTIHSVLAHGTQLTLALHDQRAE